MIDRIYKIYRIVLQTPLEDKLSLRFETILLRWPSILAIGRRPVVLILLVCLT